jgi:glucokinase
VDVGGTKILAAVWTPSRGIVGRKRCPTPFEGDTEKVIEAILGTIEEAMQDAGVSPEDVSAIGLAIPGVVDPDSGRVAITPNMNLTGANIVKAIQKRIKVPIELGNDVNLGTLGEVWLGAARDAASVVGMFIGTGIGGGLFLDGKIIRGCRETAGEIGLMVMEIGGPKCGCGSRGCLEAIASRTAIERDIRKAVRKGAESAIADLAKDFPDRIKSSALREALDAEDPVVSAVMEKASSAIGYACLSIRHLLDPEVIVLGGGVIEACGEFMLPIIDRIMAEDPLTGARSGGRVMLSLLGDDAVVLGGVALAMQKTGANPFEAKARRSIVSPSMEVAGPGEVVVEEKGYQASISVRLDGKVRKLKVGDFTEPKKTGRREVTKEGLEKAARGGPAVLFVGRVSDETAEVPRDGLDLLNRRGIEVRVLPLKKAVTAYVECEERKAIVLLLDA